MSKMERLDSMNNYGSSTGAFKSVDIFDHYVRKMAHTNEEDSYKMSRDEAQEYSHFYDDENVFHYSWVETQWGSDYGDPEDCNEELATEFNYAKRKSHLPIIVPILEGDETCYIMPKAKTFFDYDGKIIPKRVLDRRSKYIKVMLTARVRQVGGKSFYFEYSRRFNDLILLGIKAGLSDKKIISNLFWFVAEDAGSGLLRDMHRANICIYRNNLATFDMGQISDYKRPIRKVCKSAAAEMIDGWYFKYREKNKARL